MSARTKVCLFWRSLIDFVSFDVVAREPTKPELQEQEPMVLLEQTISAGVARVDEARDQSVSVEVPVGVVAMDSAASQPQEGVSLLDELQSEAVVDVDDGTPAMQ